MGNAVGRDVASVDSFDNDYSTSEYRGRRHGGGHGGRDHGGYSQSTGSEYDTGGTWGGNTTQYSQSEARNQNEDPSSGESERKDRYYPYENQHNNDRENYNSDSDSVTEITDMGHHGKNHRRRRPADRYKRDSVESDDESSVSENDRIQTPCDSSDGDEDEIRDVEESYQEEYDPNIRRASSEPLKPYASQQRLTRPNQRTSNRQQPRLRLPQVRAKTARSTPTNEGERSRYFRGMSAVHLQQVDEEAYEMYADIETKGTLSPQNSLQVLMSRSRSKSPVRVRSSGATVISRSQSMSPKMEKSLTTSILSSRSRSKSPITVESHGVSPNSQSAYASQTASDGALAPPDIMDELIEVSKSRPGVLVNHTGTGKNDQRALEDSDDGDESARDADEAFNEEKNAGVHPMSREPFFRSSAEQLENALPTAIESFDKQLGDVVLKMTLSGQPLELMPVANEDRMNSMSGETNPNRLQDQNDDNTRESQSSQYDDDEESIPRMRSLSPSAAMTENLQDEFERLAQISLTTTAQDQSSMVQTKKPRKETAPTPETAPRSFSPGPLFQPQYHYVQQGTLKDSAEYRSKHCSKSESFDRARSPSPPSKGPGSKDSMKSRDDVSLRQGSKNSDESKDNLFWRSTKRGPTPEIPETHTLTLLQHNTYSFETGITNTESKLASMRRAQSNAAHSNVSKQALDTSPSASQSLSQIQTNSDSLLAHASIKEVKAPVPVESPTKKFRDGEDLRVTVDDQSVEASRLHLPEEKLAQSILNARIKRALATGTSPSSRSDRHRGRDGEKLISTLSHLPRSHSLISSHTTVSEALSEIGDVDLYFVQQYEIAFDVFMQQNIALMARNPELVYNLRVAKLQQMLQVTADVETTLKSQINIKQEEKRVMLDAYKKQLVEAARRKAALETHLRHQLSIIEQATLAMKGKLTWQAIAANNKRAKRHYDILQRLSREKLSPLVLLNRLPKESVSSELRDAVTAPASSTFSNQEERALQQLQVDTTFLKAEVKVLEKALAAEQVNSKRFAWVDSLLIRMDPSHLKRLQSRYQKKLGSTVDIE